MPSGDGFLYYKTAMIQLFVFFLTYPDLTSVSSVPTGSYHKKVSSSIYRFRCEGVCRLQVFYTKTLNSKTAFKRPLISFSL